MWHRHAAALLARVTGGRALSCCAAAASELAGTVSAYDQHVLLQLPRPPDARDAPAGAWWPPLVEREPAVVAAFAAVARLGTQHELGTVKVTAVERLGRGGPPAGAVDLLAFPSALHFERLPLEHVGTAVAAATAPDPERPPLRAVELRALQARAAAPPRLSLLVCCHASRDERCGAAGPPLAAALQRAVRARGVEGDVAVFACSHVGGHKHAANLLAYGPAHPCDGDWFGGLAAGQAGEFLDALLGVQLGVDGGAEDPALRPHWRGRMGLTKEEQRVLWEQGGAIEELGSEEEEEEDEELERLIAERHAAMR